MTTESEIIYAPRGKATEPSIPVDMGYWAAMEARIQEVASVTPTKAPELLATFNRAALDLDRLANTFELEHQVAVREAEKVRAHVILDKVPKILVEKGMSTSKSPMGSEDIRNAILAQDEEYDQALERAEVLKAMTKMLRGKYDAFERAFRSVRTLVGEQNFNFSNKNLSGGTGTAAPGAPAATGFGRPKY